MNFTLGPYDPATRAWDIGVMLTHRCARELYQFTQNIHGDIIQHGWEGAFIARAWQGSASQMLPLARPYQFTVFVSENVKMHRTRIEKASRICLLTLTGGFHDLLRKKMWSLVHENPAGSQHFIGLLGT